MFGNRKTIIKEKNLLDFDTGSTLTQITECKFFCSQ